MKKLIFLLALVFGVTLFASCAVSDGTVSDGQNETTATEFREQDISDEAIKYAEENVTEDGVYTTPATVAAYIHVFNKLPQNFITKKEAQQLGWDSVKGNLNDVAPGKSIGGDTFGNREKLLPKGKKYRECDVNYHVGRRGAERIIYSSDGDVYYTNDHYSSFTKIY